MQSTRQRCPIAGLKVDERASRVNGALVVLALALAAFTPYWWFVAYLAIDFAIKVFGGFAFSPNCIAAGAITRGLRLAPLWIDFAPKRFAAMVGLLMSSAAVVAHLAGSTQVFLGIVGLFALFAFLESAFGFCAGCMIYGLLPERLALALAPRAKAGVEHGAA